MATAYYVVPATEGDPPSTTVARAAALTCTLCTGDPSGKATVFPSAVILSTAIAPAVYPDTAGQATLTDVTAAMTAAETAEAAVVANTTTLQTRAKTAVTSNLSWLTAASKATYPLTTAEQKSLVSHVEALTRQMDAVVKLVLELVQTLTGT